MSSTLNYYELNRELDKVKADLFSTKHAAFYGPLLCSMKYIWDEKIPTACTDGLRIYFNPHFFLKLSRETRKTVLRHELDHPARLYFARQCGRDSELWNQATDYRINNDLDNEYDKEVKLYSFEGIEWCFLDHTYPRGMSEEEIYDLIFKTKPPKNPQNLMANDALPPLSKEEQIQAVNNVIQATLQAKAAGAGNMPSDIEKILDQFLESKVAWQSHIGEFFTELVQDDYSYSRRNRRFPHVYLPSLTWDESALAHLAYFEDVSGSISNDDMIQFNSELRHLKETYRPSRMTIIQFDTELKQIDEFGPHDEMNYVVRRGYGGTGWACIRDYIEEKRPTAVVIFSDMDFYDTLEPPSFNIPILWVGINTTRVMPFGKTIHIE